MTRVAVGIDSAEVHVVSQALNEVVFGQPHPLVCPHTVVTQVLLAVDTVGCGWVLLITGAALRLSEVVRVQQASMGEMEAGGASTQTSPVVVTVLVLDLLRAHHHIQQVAEEEIGGGQGVHPGLRDGHLLVASGAPELQWVPRTPLALQTLPAEGMEAGKDVEPPGGLAGGARGM